MMSTPSQRHQAWKSAELNALTTQVIDMVQRDDTVRQTGIYERLMVKLAARAAELGPKPKPPLADVNDWLAVALFLDDRRYFQLMCRAAEHVKDPIYHRAKPWLQKFVKRDTDRLNTAQSGG
jgi:cobalamin biosynthesis protein CobD/CbiB